MLSGISTSDASVLSVEYRKEVQERQKGGGLRLAMEKKGVLGKATIGVEGSKT
jgi:hypothetical protein